MPAAGDSSSGSGTGARAGSLVARRFGDTVQFELDLPSAGGGLRPTIWSGSLRVEPGVWSSIRAALDAVSLGLRADVSQIDDGRTRVAPSATAALERLGGLMHRHLLPDEVQEDLQRYIGPLLIATDDPSLPWELLHDGRDFLALRHALGRRLVTTGRRRTGPESEASLSNSALLVGNPSGNLPDAEREVEVLADLLSPHGPCTVLKGPRASRAALLDALTAGSYGLIHFAGQLHVNTDEPRQSGLVLANGDLVRVADLEGAVRGEPLVFINGRAVAGSSPFYLGGPLEALASALANAGARAFLAPTWLETGSGARQFAIDFYSRSAEGLNAGESLRQARATARARSDQPIWASYLLYGDPGTTVLAASGGAVITLRPRVRFGPFILEQEIGRGGMGVVWKAYQPSLDRFVALKFLPSIHGELDNSRERFRREARVVARLRHPNVLNVHDFGEEQGHLYLVTEYVDGGTLQDVMRREQVLTPARAIPLLAPIAAALDHLHSQGIIHRDVKPSNILLQLDETPVLADCGVARLLDEASQMTGTGAVVGTPSYMSPEQAQGQEAAPASDQYSFGVMTFEALTGRPPFEGRTPVATALAHLQQEPPRPRDLNPQLSAEVEEVLLRVLAKNPAERYPSVRAFVDILAAAANTAPGPTPALLTPPPPPMATEVIDTPLPTPRPTTPRPGTSVALDRIGPAAQPVLATPPVAIPSEVPRGRASTLIPTLIVVAALVAAVAFVMSQYAAAPGESVAAPRAKVTPAGGAAETSPAGSALTSVPPIASGASASTPPLPPTATGVPTATAAPTATPVPPALAEWSALQSKLDGGLWWSDLPGAAKELESYLARYGTVDAPQPALAREKLYAASVNLGQQAVSAGDFAAARSRYARATEIRANDPLAMGELRKLDLLLSGIDLTNRQDWAGAVSQFDQLVSIHATFGGASERLAVAQTEFAKTWTPTPLPAPTQAPAVAPAPARAPAPAPAPARAPAPAPAPAPAAAPTKRPFVPATN